MKNACPRCGKRDAHEFVGNHLRVWFRCSCGFSWHASLLASVLTHRRSATGSTRNGPAAATSSRPADESQAPPGLPPRVIGHDGEGMAGDLETWLDGTEGEFPRRPLTQTPSAVSAILDDAAIAVRPIVEDRPPEGAVRATRYRVTLPLQYRGQGTHQWCQGFAENLSRSGILFRFGEDLLGLTEEGFEHGTLELRLKLRRVGSCTAAGPILCHGAVVRVETPGELRTQPAVAVAFDAGPYGPGQSVRTGRADRGVRFPPP